MKLKTTENIISALNKFIISMFSIFTALINISITLFLMVGSLCSMLLLFKLYPELFMSVFSRAYPVGVFLFNFCKYLLTVMLIATISSVLFYLIRYFTFSDKKRKKKREKFIDDIISKINKRGKN